MYIPFGCLNSTLLQIASQIWRRSRVRYIDDSCNDWQSHGPLTMLLFPGYISRHLELVCDTVFQQYDNLYGFGRVFNVLSDPLPWVLLSAAFSSISSPRSPPFSLFLSLSRYILLFPFLPSRLTLSLPSRGSLRRASARFYPAFRDWRHLSWMDRQSSFASVPLRAHLPLAALVAAPLRQCLFAHSMGDYAASEFTHSRKVRASRRRSPRNRARLTLRSLTQRCYVSIIRARKIRQLKITNQKWLQWYICSSLESSFSICRYYFSFSTPSLESKFVFLSRIFALLQTIGGVIVAGIWQRI